MLSNSIWRSDHTTIWLRTFVDHTNQFCTEVYTIIVDLLSEIYKIIIDY